MSHAFLNSDVIGQGRLHRCSRVRRRKVVKGLPMTLQALVLLFTLTTCIHVTLMQSRLALYMSVSKRILTS